MNSDLTGGNGPYTTNLITIAPGDTKVYIDAGLYNCCDFAQVKSVADSCCSGITSKCEVTSVNVNITNGVISSSNWNCGILPGGYVGQTNYTFTLNTACALDLDICFNPTNANPVVITYTVTLADGCICTKTDIKRCPCAYISGVMWYDLDNNGIHDLGENGLFPHDVYLVNSSGTPIMSTTTTSPSGAYSFSCMPPGQYYVQFDPPAGYEPSPGNATGSSPNTDSDINLGNGTYNTDPINVSNGDTINNLDAGLFYCCDFVLIEDTNDSCCSRITSLCAVDSINVNVQNGTISLISWNCAPRLNNYAFSGLSNFTLGIPNNCPLSFGVCVDPIYTSPYAPVIITYTVYSSSGAVCTKYDTLYCPCAVITGEAWYDSNGDGIYQQIENGINGMLIQLVDAMTGKTVSAMETIPKPGTSSDDGYYEFPCVKPGMYFVKFDSLPDFTTSTPLQGGNAETDSDITGTYGTYTTYKITIMNGDTFNNIDGGYRDSASIAIGHLTIGGLINTESTKAMLASKVNLATINNPNYKSVWSQYSGNYAFSDLTFGQDYRISVENDDEPLQGVSTRDIVLIQKHILGIKYLDSPYKIIAADVNSSQSITASDLAELRKLILGVIETFPKNKSWRFIPKNYVFKNTSSPFPFEEYILHSKMENNKMSSDFYAVKIGDVSGNALGLINNITRSVRNMQLIFEKESYKKNEEISVPVRLSESGLLNGFQLALKISEELEFITIEKGSLNITQENYRFNRGQLKISYNEAQGFDVGNKDIFIIKLKAKTDLNIDRKISTSNVIETEAYGVEDQVMSLVVNNVFAHTKLSSGVYKFYSAKPNPFNQETIIEFEIPDDEQILFNVYNPEGKLVWSKEKIYLSGSNQISISKEDLGHVGLYYLHIQSKGFYKTQRILFIE
ncbi:MAG: T9SS type A sorting domain-containing protein [Saprospiraceae bacterium]|nr:T9SS type A sorting domain-containing protein [Candidatus Defluviibacterium haderslevense]